MKRCVLIPFLLFLLPAACVSSDVPKYTSKIEPAGDATFVIRLVSERGLSREEVQRALLSEAARATIDRGKIYLRIEEMRDDEARHARSAYDPNSPPRVPNVSEPDVEKSMTRNPVAGAVIEVRRTRTGYVRFTILTPAESGPGSFDASRLLDQLRRGDPLPNLGLD